MHTEICPHPGESDFDVIYKETVAAMEKLGTYKPEFMPVIVRYCEMRLQYKLLMERWYADGCRISEEYTNKAGATNIRKTALYLSIESLRKELLVLDTDLGLTPIGLKRINDEMKKNAKKTSALGEAIRQLSREYGE